MRYADGLPRTGLRPLLPEERDAIRSARRRLRWRAAAALLIVPGSFAALVAVVSVVEALGLRGPTAEWILGVAGLLAILLGIPVSLSLLLDALRPLRALGRDLRAGTVEEFGDDARRLGVLPASARVVAIDGATVAPVRRAVVGEAAPPGEAVAHWAVPLSKIPDPLRRFAWARRPLAPDERDEVGRRAAELRRIPPALAVGTALAVAAVLAALPEGPSAPAATAFRVVAWIAIFGFAWSRVMRRRAAGARLAVDAQEGWVARATEGEAAGAEVLPVSGLPWTKGGAPATWRLSSSRPRRRRV